jgi:hypothetical protein
LGPDNRIWAQQDMLLEEGGLTTSAWEMGQVVKDEYRLELAPHAPAGEYIMLAGIYYWETGERLPVWDEQGERATDAVITLGSITIINSRKPQMSHSGLDS